MTISRYWSGTWLTASPAERERGSNTLPSGHSTYFNITIGQAIFANSKTLSSGPSFSARVTHCSSMRPGCKGAPNTRKNKVYPWNCRLIAGNGRSSNRHWRRVKDELLDHRAPHSDWVFPARRSNHELRVSESINGGIRQRRVKVRASPGDSHMVFNF